MKVLFIIDDDRLRGGTEIVARNICTALTARGVECRLLARASVLKPRGRWGEAIDKLLGGMLSDRAFAQIIARTAATWGADWVIGHNYDLVASLPRGGRWKTAQVFNWSVAGYEAAGRVVIARKRGLARCASHLAFAMKRWRWHRAMRRLDARIVLTQAALAEMPGPAVVIPDPIMYSSPSPTISNLHNHRVLFVGRLVEVKGVMRLLRIWRQVQAALPEYTLSIYGEGDLQAQMAAEPVPGVRFEGFECNLAGLYPNGDLLLLTSDTEGFGMVLVEAMYFGVPGVSFDCPTAPREVLGPAGVVVPAFDEEKYAKTVIELLQDPARMQKLQVAALKRAQDFYVDRVVEQWMTVLGN